jgi:hypothetical protein
MRGSAFPGGSSSRDTDPVPLGDVLEQTDLAFLLMGEPALPPRLNVATSPSGLRLSWTTNAFDYHLVSTDSLPATVWNTVTNTPYVSGSKFVVDIGVIAALRYFRLHKP